VDVYETADRYVIAAELPGLLREQIELALEADRLIIRGQRTVAPPDIEADAGTEEGLLYHQVERGHGAFARTFEFADRIDVESVTADLSNGLLTVTLPKVPAQPTRKIEVR